MPSSRLADVLPAMAPRHLESARRSGAVLTAVGALVTTAFALLEPGTVSPFSTDALVPLLLALTSFALLVAPARQVPAWCVLTAVLGAVSVGALDLATSDATAAGQVFFVLPVLYAASQLRPGGAVLVTVVAVAADAVVALRLLPAERALTDLAYVTVTLVAAGVLLSRASADHDRLVEQLRRQAAIDPLTGLVTRRVLDDAAQCAITSAAQPGGTSLVLLDVDRFKAVNDTHGHPVGDDALSHVAALLSGLSRTGDVVARMGGDELAVLLPGCGYESAVQRAEAMVAAVRSTPLVLADGTVLLLSVSAGVAHAPGHARAVRDLYALADTALYRAKRTGRGRVGLVVAQTAQAAATA